MLAATFGGCKASLKDIVTVFGLETAAPSAGVDAVIRV